MQTPSLVAESDALDLLWSMATTSAKILSPDLRHSSPIVRDAVYHSMSSEQIRGDVLSNAPLAVRPLRSTASQ